MESGMPFWKRLMNFYEVWTHIYSWVNVYAPIEDTLAKKYLGNDVPYVEDITKNMSIYIVNRNIAISYARIEQPNIIFYQGFHIAAEPPALPQVYIHTYIYLFIYLHNFFLEVILIQ